MAAREGSSSLVHFGTVMLLDRAPDFDVFRRRMERTALAIPRLRQRVLPSAAYVSPPTWVDDPDFDIDLHVRRIACPKPGTLRQVLDLASLIVADPFDRTRPLWQFMVVEGLRGGKAAVIQKMHHTITDGERGVELSLQYLDFERDAPEPPPIDPDTAERAEVPQPSPADTIRELRRRHDADPDRHRQAGARPARRPGRRFPTRRRPPPRRCAASSASCPTPRRRGRRCGRGVRCSAGSRRHGRRSGPPRTPPSGSAARSTPPSSRPPPTPPRPITSRWAQPVESLRASMAISTRTDDSGANAFTLARLLVPTGEMPIAERFLAIDEATKVARAVDEGRRARHARRRHDGDADVADHAARPPAGATRSTSPRRT